MNTGQRKKVGRDSRVTPLLFIGKYSGILNGLTSSVEDGHSSKVLLRVCHPAEENQAVDSNGTVVGSNGDSRCLSTVP